jgi:hypothetical protein
LSGIQHLHILHLSPSHSTWSFNQLPHHHYLYHHHRRGLPFLSFSLASSLPLHQATSDCPSFGTSHIPCWKPVLVAIFLSALSAPPYHLPSSFAVGTSFLSPSLHHNQSEATPCHEKRTSRKEHFLHFKSHSNDRSGAIYHSA